MLQEYKKRVLKDSAIFYKEDVTRQDGHGRWKPGQTGCSLHFVHDILHPDHEVAFIIGAFAVLYQQHLW